MKPVLYSFGPLKIYSFGVMILTGVMLSLYLMERRARHDGFPKIEEIFDLVFVTVLAGFLGARLGYVLQHFSWYREHLFHVIAFWEGGLVFFGGLIAAVAALSFFIRLRTLPFWKTIDFLTPYVVLTHGFGRIGCFLNGCCGGKACSLPWAVRFPGFPEAVHPTQLYEAFFLFALFFILERLYPRRRFPGEVAAVYFLCYSVERFVVEFFRAGNPAWQGLTYNQWFAILLFIGTLFFYRWKKRGTGLV